MAEDNAAALAVGVVDRETGRPVRWQRPELTFRSASLVKLLIALDMLDRHPLSQDLADRVRLMLSASDDDVADEFWDGDGGPAIVVRTAARLGLPTAGPPEIVGRWGDTMLSVADVVATYRYVLDTLPADQRELIVDALAAAPRHGSDGFDQYFGVPSGLPRPWAIKQGWSRSPRDVVLHSSGLVGEGWRFIVVVLASFPVGTGWGRATAAVDDVVALLAADM